MPDTPSQLAADPPRVIAAASDYSAFLQAIRDRVAALNITHETLDEISGLQSGYSSKLLCNPPIRRMGPIVLYVVLQSLGMKIALVEDREALRAVASRLVPRKVPLKAPAGEGRRARARWHKDDRQPTTRGGGTEVAAT